MKRSFILSMSLSGIIGLCGVGSISSSAFAGEERASIAHQHENVTLPTKRLMVEFEKRTYNILEGILIGNFKSVKQEAGAISEAGNKVLENFFPRNPDIDAWYKRSKDLDPSNIEAIKKLKEEFSTYLKRVDAGVQEIQKAADTNDTEVTYAAFSGLLTKACFECHRRMRDTK